MRCNDALLARFWPLVQALRHYEGVDGPFKERAAQLHRDLRDVLVRSIVREYGRTGFLWENYDCESGRGRGTHPFTGWTSLVVLILADQY
jgi:mannosyl-oligosaccharide glucosidase